MVNEPPSNPSAQFSWSASIIGGLAAVGSSALFGTLVSNINLSLTMGRGLTLEQAYAQFAAGPLSTSEILSLVVLSISNVFGGYVAAMHGGPRHIAQAVIVGLISTVFFIVMVLGPINPPVPAWNAALNVATALLSSIVGGYAYARRA